MTWNQFVKTETESFFEIVSSSTGYGQLGRNGKSGWSRIAFEDELFLNSTIRNDYEILSVHAKNSGDESFVEIDCKENAKIVFAMAFSSDYFSDPILCRINNRIVSSLFSPNETSREFLLFKGQRYRLSFVNSGKQRKSHTVVGIKRQTKKSRIIFTFPMNRETGYSDFVRGLMTVDNCLEDAFEIGWDLSQKPIYSKILKYPVWPIDFNTAPLPVLQPLGSGSFQYSYFRDAVSYRKWIQEMFSAVNNDPAYCYTTALIHGLKSKPLYRQLYTLRDELEEKYYDWKVGLVGHDPYQIIHLRTCHVVKMGETHDPTHMFGYSDRQIEFVWKDGFLNPKIKTVCLVDNYPLAVELKKRYKNLIFTELMPVHTDRKFQARGEIGTDYFDQGMINNFFEFKLMIDSQRIQSFANTHWNCSGLPVCCGLAGGIRVKVHGYKNPSIVSWNE